jgi:phenylalanyl-tRNA synthetase alpha chain
MNYKIGQIENVAVSLRKRFDEIANKSDILKAPELKDLYADIVKLPPEERAAFGQEVNQLREELTELVNKHQVEAEDLVLIDVTAPFDANVSTSKEPTIFAASIGSVHPLISELRIVCDIFYRMGFEVVESRQIDDDYHMFTSLNFPLGHPARDEYDTFLTTEGLIAPAHVSTMQNRLLKKYKSNLDDDRPISCIYTGRTFRNEDVDARHEHTFYQVEIMYVDKAINASNLIATFKTFLEAYYGQSLEIKSQPFYFPFTEPSLELALSCPFCQKKGCNICSYVGWIELLGMGMVHPNVLKMAGIDPDVYTGFAGGMGLDRLVMMKHDIEDVRYFESGRLDFLRQFR